MMAEYCKNLGERLRTLTVFSVRAQALASAAAAARSLPVNSIPTSCHSRSIRDAQFDTKLSLHAVLLTGDTRPCTGEGGRTIPCRGEEGNGWEREQGRKEEKSPSNRVSIILQSVRSMRCDVRDVIGRV